MDLQNGSAAGQADQTPGGYTNPSGHADQPREGLVIDDGGRRGHPVDFGGGDIGGGQGGAFLVSRAGDRAG